MIRIWDYLTSLGYHNCWDISGWDILVLFIATLNYTHPTFHRDGFTESIFGWVIIDDLTELGQHAKLELLIYQAH